MKPYYSDDAVTIYHADCREVLPTLSGVDLVLTSPPYNLGTSSGGGFPGKGKPLGQRGGNGKWSGGSLAGGYASWNDALPHDDYVAWQHEVLRACWSTLGPGGAIYYNHKPRVLDGLLVTPFAYNPDLPVRQIVVWARAGGVNFSPSFYVPTHEWLMILARPAFRLKSQAASGVGDVWYIPQESNTEHPAPFPLALASRVMETTKPGVVLDPFCGSGTTLRAAKSHGRRGLGIEIDEAYCEMAAKRCAQEVLDLEGAA